MVTLHTWLETSSLVENVMTLTRIRDNYTSILFFPPDFLSTSSNPLLEFCLDGGNFKNFNVVEVEALDPLLQACLDFTKSPLTTDLKRTLDHLGQNGCDINVQNSKGNTALHILLKGKSDWIDKT